MGVRKIHRNLKFSNVSVKFYDTEKKQMQSIIQNYRYLNDNQLKKEIQEDFASSPYVVVDYTINSVFRIKFEMDEEKFIHEAKAIEE